MKVVVTGAAGFLGTYVVAACLRRGHRVRAIVRPSTHVERLPWHRQTDFFRADLRAGTDLRAAFDNADALIHLAAAVSGDDESQFANTVVGTERLLESMRGTGVTRLILASSMSVYDWSRIHGTLTEESPILQNPYARDGYAVAKLWQERVARKYASENEWRLTILRPGFIWGLGREYIAGLGPQIGRAHLVFGERTKLPLTYVENCAASFVTALENNRAGGQAFNVVDDEGVRAWNYAGEYLRRSGSRGFRCMVPYWLGMSAARLAQRVSRVIFKGKGKLPSIFVPCRFEARFKPVRFSNCNAREILGWRPEYSYEQCLDRTYGAVEQRSRPDVIQPSIALPATMLDECIPNERTA